MEVLENLVQKAPLISSKVEEHEILFQDPKLYFEDFVKRMEREGYSFDVESDKGRSGEIFSVSFITKKEHKELGLINVEYIDFDKVLKIDYIGGKERNKEEDKWKPNGIGSALFAYMLTLYPETQEIEARLRHDNIQVYKEFIKHGLSKEGALKETPAYKIFAKFGYADIVLDYWEAPREVQGNMQGQGKLVTKKS